MSIKLRELRELRLFPFTAIWYKETRNVFFFFSLASKPVAFADFNGLLAPYSARYPRRSPNAAQWRERQKGNGEGRRTGLVGGRGWEGEKGGTAGSGSYVNNTKEPGADPFAFIWSNLTGPNSQLRSAAAKRKLKKHKVTSPFRSFLSSTCFPPLVCQRPLSVLLPSRQPFAQSFPDCIMTREVA